MSENTGAGEPQATTEISRDARKLAMICHIVALVGLLGNGIGFLIGPLVVWLVKKEDDPFVYEQGREAVNFQLTMLLAVIVSIVLCFVFIGFFILPIVLLMMIIFPIIAAMKANDGEHYRYPVTFRVL